MTGNIYVVHILSAAVSKELILKLLAAAAVIEDFF
jgi:hypothetical protein